MRYHGLEDVRRIASAVVDDRIKARLRARRGRPELRRPDWLSAYAFRDARRRPAGVPAAGGAAARHA